MLDDTHRAFFQFVRQEHGLDRHAARYVARQFQLEAKLGLTIFDPLDPNMRGIYVRWLASIAKARPDARPGASPPPLQPG